MATKYLDKWRPGFVQSHSQPAIEGAPAEGSASEAAEAAPAVAASS